MAADEYAGLERFADVDATGEEAMFVEFLERVEQLPDIVARRQRSYGCSPLVRASVSPTSAAGSGRPPGSSPPAAHGRSASTPARRCSRRRGVADPEAALAEARRVLAGEGRIVLVDQDWGGLVIDGEPEDVTRAILAGHSDSIRNGWMGRSYLRLLRDAGFADVSVQAETVPITAPWLAALMPKLAADAAVETGAVDAEVAKRWLADQGARLERKTFFAAMAHFIAVARRRA